MVSVVPLRKLFLSYHSDFADEVRELATELRLRGIVPWVDKDGGFRVGDESEAEARRAIREDCFGLLLYATETVFDRPFIRDVELDEARKVRAEDPAFVLFAMPRDLSFQELKTRSAEEFGINLSAFHGVPVHEATKAADWQKAASETLE